MSIKELYNSQVNTYYMQYIPMTNITIYTNEGNKKIINEEVKEK